VIAERYELRQLIGRGGMGCVWRAEHRTLRTPVAVKLLTPTAHDRDEVLARFSREAQAAASLRGANVVHILDHGVDNGVPYIAMELLEGETLGARLNKVGKLRPLDAAAVFTGVVRAMARAHRVGIVHRDLKPDNIFLARDEESGLEVVKVLDFGIAKVVASEASIQAGEGSSPTVPSDASTRTGVVMGTPFYMSPEQARGRKDLDERADLWSVAVMAFECLTGRRPFHASMLADLLVQICADPIPVPSTVGPVPSGFDAWFERATRRDPAARFQNVRELATGLSAVLTPGKPWLDLGVDTNPGYEPDPGPPKSFEVAPTQPLLTTTMGKVASRSIAHLETSSPAAGLRSRARVIAMGVVTAAAAAFGLIRRGAAPPAGDVAGAPPAVGVVHAPDAIVATPPSSSPGTAAPPQSSRVPAPPPASASANAPVSPAVPAGSAPAPPRHSHPKPAPAASVNLGI
jgi:serine/threonine-protein kinase